MNNIKIKDMAIYHSENVVDNEYYLNHFQKQGKDISDFLNLFGRKERYILDDENETGLTMGIKAANKALQKANLSAKDIDMIVFTTQVPETTLPSNAIMIHKALEASSDCIIYDLNANCAGMVIAIEQVSYYMKGNHRINRALIIGSDYFSLISDPNDAFTYASFADGAAAVILERTDEDTGFIDAIYYVDPIVADKMMYPAEGLAKGILETKDLKYIKNSPMDGTVTHEPTHNMISTLLERNGLKPKDAKYCFSQLSLNNINRIKGRLELTDEQVVYVGDRFGYTGTSSPIIALHEGVESGQINRNDYVVFWTIAAGFELIAMLYKY